jgi:hypothetical protein
MIGFAIVELETSLASIEQLGVVDPRAGESHGLARSLLTAAGRPRGVLPFASGCAPCRSNYG